MPVNKAPTVEYSVYLIFLYYNFIIFIIFLMILIIMTIEKFQYNKNSNLEPKLRGRQKKSLCIFQSRCGVASELVHWTPD